MGKAHNPLTTCLNLRSKQMYYEGIGTRPDEHDLEVERLFGACDTTVFWCRCTQTGRGPDSQIVGREECSQLGRKCFVGIESLK